MKMHNTSFTFKHIGSYNKSRLEQYPTADSPQDWASDNYDAPLLNCGSDLWTTV